MTTSALQNGDKEDCTITNHRLPRLEVVKSLVPAGDAGLFNLEVDVQTFAVSGVGYCNIGNTGFVDVSTGTHLIGEAANSNSPTALTDYDSSVSCDNGD